MCSCDLFDTSVPRSCKSKITHEARRLGRETLYIYIHIYIYWGHNHLVQGRSKVTTRSLRDTIGAPLT